MEYDRCSASILAGFDGYYVLQLMRVHQVLAGLQHQPSRANLVPNNPRFR